MERSGASLGDNFGQREVIASEEVDTPPHDGGKASLVDWVDRASFPFDLANDFLHVDGVPVGNGVEDQTEDAKVFLLPLPQRISDFPALAQEQLAAEAVAGFLPVELDENAPAESRVVDISEDMESLTIRPSSVRARASVVGLSLTCIMRMTPAALRWPSFREPARRMRSGQF